MSNVDSTRVGIVGLGGTGTRHAANFEEAGAEIAGGGALVDIGVHALDFALYLFDSRR